MTQARTSPIPSRAEARGIRPVSSRTTFGLLDLADELCASLRKLSFSAPVAYVYNPLEYARAGYDAYVTRYGTRPRDVLLLGMNPGPFGMVQTGVPFGEVNHVRDWLGIEEAIDRPPREHPKRRVEGFSCRRSEVSGARLWGWARDAFGTPRRFFDRFFVGNYCPLAFLESSGRNRTPDKLAPTERRDLFAACDDALRRTVEYLRPKFVIGVGAFATERAKLALPEFGGSVGTILHPSPASPQANRGWARQCTRQLRNLGIAVP